MAKSKEKQPRINRARRLALCAEYGVPYSPRQWVRLRRELRRAGISLEVKSNG